MNDLAHLKTDYGKKLRRVERKSGCAVRVPPVTARDPLDGEVKVEIFGDESGGDGEAAERGVRDLTVAFYRYFKNKKVAALKGRKPDLAGD